MLRLVFLSVLGLFCNGIAEQLFKNGVTETTEAFMYLDNEGNPYVSSDGSKTGYVAHASFTDKRFEEGFTYVTVSSNPGFEDLIQAYCAGYLEGYLTQHLINLTFYNNKMDEVRLGDDVNGFLTENYQYVKANADSKKDENYWYQAGLLLFQIKGIEDAFLGNQPIISNDIDPLGHIWLLNWKLTELWDVQRKFMGEYALLGDSEEVFGSGSCSALVKNLGDDLVVAHVTWSGYNMMLRTVKKYDLPYRVSYQYGTTVPGSVILQSSYPGLVHSVDDYYVTNQQLAVTETTNGIYNQTLFQDIQAQGSVPYFLRVVLANRLSTSGEDWVKLFSKFNSGTYNNQWMVVDYKKFTQKYGAKAGTLWVLEQMPGFVVSKDMSATLQSGKNAWTSYNAPYFQKTQDFDNITAQINEYGPFFSHDSCPRAKIFDRDVHKVVDMNTTIALMRYNDFQNDPYAKSNCTPLGYSAENGISARCDLNPLNSTCKIASEGPRCHGATDLKVVNMQMVANLQMVAISGPTHEQQPVFDWGEQENTACRDARHEGHPKRFKFSPVHVQL